MLIYRSSERQYHLTKWEKLSNYTLIQIVSIPKVHNNRNATVTVREVHNHDAISNAEVEKTIAWAGEGLKQLG